MVTPEGFREVMSNFAAGVTVVTLAEPPHGITVNAFASVSLSPTLVLICLDHDTEAHERLAAGDTAFCVNVLAADQQHLGEHFARMVDLGDPFADEPTGTAATGAPVFEESVAYLDCSLANAVRAGDHTIYVGEVESADVLRDGAAVLTYFRGEWGSMSGASSG